MTYKRYSAIPSKKSPTPSSAPNPKKDRAELGALIDMVTDLVGKNPDKAATILSDWLNSNTQTKKNKKAA